MHTRLVPEIMHQNLAIILWQFNYGKNSFIALVPGLLLTKLKFKLNAVMAMRGAH